MRSNSVACLFVSFAAISLLALPTLTGCEDPCVRLSRLQQEQIANYEALYGMFTASEAGKLLVGRREKAIGLLNSRFRTIPFIDSFIRHGSDFLERRLFDHFMHRYETGRFNDIPPKVAAFFGSPDAGALFSEYLKNAAQISELKSGACPMNTMAPDEPIVPESVYDAIGQAIYF